MKKIIAFLIILLFLVGQGYACNKHNDAPSPAEVALDDAYNRLYTQQQMMATQSEIIAIQEDVISMLEQEVIDVTCPDLYYFSTEKELVYFLAQDKTNENEFVETTYDCDDFSFDLVNNAKTKGYIIHPEVLIEQGHMICWTLVGNKVYLIEPQTDEYIAISNLDKEVNNATNK